MCLKELCQKRGGEWTIDAANSATIQLDRMPDNANPGKYQATIESRITCI